MSPADPDLQRKGHACPVCGRPSDPAYRPFCSRHCKQLDLLRWLTEDYRVPAVEEDTAEEEDGEGLNGEEER